MATNSGIQWTHHTFNPWRGCTKVSRGCKHCYADTLSKRNPKVLGIWGPNGTRAVAAESYWREPAKWDKAAAAAGERHRVFSASLADVFEAADTMPEEAVPVVRAARLRLFDTIRRTPNLDWMLLTKRPGNIVAAIEQAALDGDRPDDTNEMLNAWLGHHGVPPLNVWLGASVEDAASRWRIDDLRKCRAAVRFLSLEPLVEDVGELDLRGIHLVIVGTESGTDRSPMREEWARSVLAQCRAAGVAFFCKQMEINGAVSGEVEDFPADLRVRQMPTKGGA